MSSTGFVVSTYGSKIEFPRMGDSRSKSSMDLTLLRVSYEGLAVLVTGTKKSVRVTRVDGGGVRTLLGKVPFSALQQCLAFPPCYLLYAAGAVWGFP